MSETLRILSTTILNLSGVNCVHDLGMVPKFEDVSSQLRLLQFTLIKVDTQNEI